MMDFFRAVDGKYEPLVTILARIQFGVITVTIVSALLCLLR